MSVYLVMPSARPAEEAIPVLYSWFNQGYFVLVQRDPGKYLPRESWFWQIERPYQGYPEAVNHLLRLALPDTNADWFVCAGDDTLPDPNKSADEIAKECSEHFQCCTLTNCRSRTFGVMQPTGDRWQVNGPGTVPGIDLIAGSPWMGREWCRRINGGRGPLWPEYFHCGADEELQEVATKLGVFWQRQDLTHLHNHWGRPRPGELYASEQRMPEFLKRANSKEEWQHYKRTFGPRKAAGFPGSEPIP